MRLFARAVSGVDRQQLAMTTAIPQPDPTRVPPEPPVAAPERSAPASGRASPAALMLVCGELSNGEPGGAAQAASTVFDVVAGAAREAGAVVLGDAAGVSVDGRPVAVVLAGGSEAALS